MASKVLDEFLKKASPETLAALQQTRQDFQRDGVQLNQGQTQAVSNSAPAERADVQQIGQELRQNGAQIKPDTYGPQTPARIGESRPHAEPPKFMDGQGQTHQQPATNEKAALQQTRQDLQRDGVQASTQAQTPKRENAMDRALAPTEKPQAQEKQKSQEHER